MPTLTGTLNAVTGGTIDNSRVRRCYVRAPRHRASLGAEGALVTTVPVPVDTDGELSISLDPGPAILVIETLDAGPDVFDLYVTEDMSLITEAIAEAAPAQERSWVESQMVQLRAATVTAAEEALEAAREAGLDRKHIDSIRDILDEAAQSNVAPYLTQSELNATYGAPIEELGVVKAERVGDVLGGQVLAPIRVPHLVVDDVYPKPHRDLLVLWAAPDGLMYASDRSGIFYKSVNHGRDWIRRGSTGAQFTHPHCFLVLPTGTLLAVDQARRVQRSTDDGVTWTATFEHRRNAQQIVAAPMGPTSWCVDQLGHVYTSEYQSDDAWDVINVYRSTDDGQSFSVFHAFPGPTTSDPDRVRHIHGVQYDRVSQRVYVTTGDPEPKTGIYRTNASTGATFLEPVITNEQMQAQGLGFMQARAIGLMFFPDSIAWGVDGTTGPNINRLPRSEIGQPNPQAEFVYRVNATSWFTTSLSTDGTVWMMSAAKEGETRIDNATHLYVVEDEGRRVYEVGSYPQSSASSNGGLAPVGQADYQSDRAWLTAYNLFDESGIKSYNSFAVRLARGVQPLQLSAPPSTMMPPVTAWQTDMARITKPADSNNYTIPFGSSRCTPTRRVLLIHDWTLRRFASETGSTTGAIRLVNVASGAVLWSSHNTGTEGSRRSSQSMMDAGWLEEIDLGGTTAIEWQVVTTNGFQGIAKVIYGWANVPVGTG